MKRKIYLLLALLMGINAVGFSQTTESVAGPEKVEPGKQYGTPPSDAIVLFNGTNLNYWVSSKNPEKQAPWLVKNGIFTVKPGTGSIQTKQSFGNFQLHIEWRTPSPPVGKGQMKGNSGIFLQGLYEVQVLSSYDNDTYIDGTAGSIYKQYPPMVNVSLPAGQWQSYDIFFTAPVFRKNGSLKDSAYVTVVQNGVLVQNHVAIHGKTFVEKPSYEKHGPLPLKLQDHGCLVSYRNIWIRKLK